MAGGRPRDAAVDERIVEATRTLLMEGGLEAVSVSAVAERAAVGRPTVYRRHPNPEALAMAVLYADLDARWSALQSEPGPADLMDFLLHVARSIYVYYDEHQRMARAVLKLSVFADGEWGQRFSMQGAQFVGWLAQQIEARREPSGYSAGLDSVLLAQTWFAAYFSIAVGGTSGLFTSVDQQVRLLRGVLEQHLHGWHA